MICSGQIGLEVIETLQRMEWLAIPMQVITGLGSELFFLLFIALLYWCVSPGLGVQVGAILLLSTALNSVVKLAFASPRPYWYSSRVKALETASSFGFPSAHAQNAVTVWGRFAQQYCRKWITGLSLGLMLVIGLSRVYLGVHFPLDVLVGWGIGAMVLLLFQRFSAPIVECMRGYGAMQRWAIALVSSILLLLPSAIASELQQPWPIPSSWLEVLRQTPAETLPQPLSLETPVSVAGTWLGLMGGVLGLEDGGFEPRGTLKTRVIRYVSGIAIALIIWGGLGAVFPDGTTAIAYSLRYLRYALLGAWIAAGAPRLFRWMRQFRS